MADTQTFNTIPSVSDTFLTDLQAFLRSEDADRFNEIFNPFVATSGLHGTGGSLVGSPGATVAFPGGYYVSTSATITYPDDTANNWVIIHKDNHTALGGDWIRQAGTNYLRDSVAAAQPTAPAGSLILMDVVTSGGSITTVSDLRNTDPTTTTAESGKFFVSVADTTRNFLDSKLTITSGITKTITSPAGDEKLELALDGFLRISANDTTLNYLDSKLTVLNGVSKSIQNAFGDETLRLTLDLASNSGLEFSTADLRVLAGPGIQRTASGTEADINGVTSISGAVDETTDTVLLYDDTASALRKVITQNIIPISSQAEAEAGTNNTKRMTPLRTHEAIVKVLPETFIASGTYNVPPEVATVMVEAIGAGGGGGGSTTNNNGGGGGGGGQYISATVSVTPAGTETVTIGSGGAGGAAGDNDGVAGGDSTFGTLVTAKGGSLGRKGTLQTGGAGGTGSSTSGTLIVAPFAHAGETGDSAGTNGGDGGSGPDEWADLKGGVGGSGSAGTAGTPLGSGGGAGGSAGGARAGGAGADGYMIVTPVI